MPQAERAPRAVPVPAAPAAGTPGGRRHLLFDLDGTLTDSGEGIMRCAQHALAAFGIRVADWRTLRPFVGPPLEDSFKLFYGFSDDDARRAAAVYRERYIPVGMFENAVYEGVERCLRTLRRRGYRLAVATSKSEALAREVLRHFRLDAYFDLVAGRDDEGLLHTKADVVRHALDRLGAAPADALMVGDRKYDVLGARAAGVDCVGVLWGYGDRAELEAAKPLRIVATADELTTLLAP